MIVREHKGEFIMIGQHDHAVIAENIIASFKEEFFPSSPLNHSVLYAIKMHDFGWKSFDNEPFWNDEKNAPYSFIDFPLDPKTVLYTHGIDTVEKIDSYAGLLCSEHYTRFISYDDSDEARAFIAREQTRQKELKERIEIKKDLFKFHFELLKLADNLSLFLCLNKPGSSQDEIHYFFKNGIGIPEALQDQLGNKLELMWLDEKTVTCEPFPFYEPVTVSIPQKKISKNQISTYGLNNTYSEAEEEFSKVKIIRTHKSSRAH